MKAVRSCALECLLAALLCSAAPSIRAESTRVLSLAEVRAQFTAPADRYVDVEGVNVHYRDEGEGPAVLLIHGTFGDLQDWNEWTRMLSARYRVVRFDLPGAGLTGPIATGNYSADRMLSLVDALMDQLGIDRFAVAGISYGGLLAFRYAATRIERVDALILANSAGIEFGGRGGTGTTSTNVVRRNILTDDSVTFADVEATLHYVLNEPQRVTRALVERKLAYANIAGRAQEGIAGAGAYERGNPQRVLAHVRAPTVILWGGGNKALSNKTADDFAAALKRASSVEQHRVEGAGHLLNVDSPDESAAAVLAFLDKVQMAGRSRVMNKP